MITFHELDLSHPVVQSITNMGFEEATPIQAKALPVALKGNDLIGQAQTGTGKTAAFGIPLVEKADPDLDKIQGIIITPTRELAVQVAEELNRIGQFKGVKTLPIYGGQDINRADSFSEKETSSDCRYTRTASGPFATENHSNGAGKNRRVG